MRGDLAITGGRVYTDGDLCDATVVVDDGTVSAVCEPDVAVETDRTVDADGNLVLPGGVDPHVHMMDPGQTEREDFPTGTAAAAAGGITTVGEHHRTDPMVLSKGVLEDKRDYLADRARVDYGLLAGGHPDNVDEVADLETAGTIAYKSFTCDVHGVPALRTDHAADLFAEVERVGGISMIHPEDERMLNANERRLKEQGRTGGEAVPEWRSREAEQVAVAKTLQVAKQTGVSLWFAHVSHPELLDQIEHARQQGVDVYAETCPQYLYLTAEDVVEDAPYTMFTPPARTEEDREALWERLEAGDIHMVNADHAPATREQKAAGEGDVFEAPFGIPGVETVLPLLLDGYARGRLSLDRLVEVFATNPARITGLYPRKGTIRVGSDADLLVVDPDRTYELRDEDVVAKCGWTPFDGLEVTGKVTHTFVRGQPVVEDGDVVGDPGLGEFVERGERVQF